MKKFKYEVGDKVRVLDGIKIKDYVGGFTYGMSNYVGKTFVVKDFYLAGGGHHAYKLEDSDYIWDERGLAPVYEPIVIYRKGDEVIALDKSTGETAKAICSKEDTFDFATGAKLAFERLMGESKAKSEVKTRFKVGDRVIGNEKANCYWITCKGWKGIVTSVLSDDFITCEGEKGKFSVRQECFDLDTSDDIKVGDTVRVINTGKMCPTYDKWVSENISDTKLIAQYAYGDNAGYPEKRVLSQKFVVKFIKVNMAYIQSDELGGKCYLINLAGLEKWGKNNDRKRISRPYREGRCC